MSALPPRVDGSHPAVRALLEVSTAELVVRRGDLQREAQAAGLTPRDVEQALNSRSDLPRPLLAEERDTLFAILRHADFDGRDALLVQADTAQVGGYCGCGCASVQLTVDASAPSAPRTPSPIPNEAEVRDEAGDDVGGIIVFLEDGRLALLEVYSHFDPISPLPPPGGLRLRQLDR